MKGISMTRDLNYAIGWGNVVLLFDRKKLESSHPIESYNWGHHIANRNEDADHKKEREDFVILAKPNRRYRNLDNTTWMEEYLEEMKIKPEDTEDPEVWAEYLERKTKKLSKVNLEDLTTPEGEFDFYSSKALLGIIIKSSTAEIYGIENPIVQYLMSQPEFLGFLDRD